MNRFMEIAASFVTSLGIASLLISLVLVPNSIALATNGGSECPCKDRCAVGCGLSGCTGAPCTQTGCTCSAATVTCCSTDCECKVSATSCQCGVK
jgi:hypothetical protein